MADNYLENQYEQYQARKAAWEKAKKSGKAQTLHKQAPPLKKSGKKCNERLTVKSKAGHF